MIIATKLVIGNQKICYYISMIIGINASFARKENTGIGQVTINFLKELSRQKTKHEFILYLEEDLPKGFRLPKNFTKKIFLPIWRRDDLIRKIWWEKRLLPKKIKRDKCDVFLSLYQTATVLPRDIPHLMVVHDVIPKFYPNYLDNSRKRKYWHLIEKAIEGAGKIIAVSHRTEKDLVQKLGTLAEKITVNYVAVDEIYMKKVSAEKNRKVLKRYKLKPGYIYAGGGLEVRKNIEGVILAYKFLLDKNKNMRFVPEMPNLVISGKLMPELAPLVTDAKSLIKKLNLTKQVKLLDFVKQKDLPTIYKNASMFVYPSHYEGFGLPVLEAMSQGVPVITSKTSSLPEVGGDSVLYCNPNDIHDIAMVMKNVMLHERLREELSRRGKERAKNFSWSRFVKKVLYIAESL